MGYIKGFNCVCDKCVCKEECGYYEETMKPIIQGASTMIYDDEFSVSIKEAINNYTCEDFEQGED